VNRIIDLINSTGTFSPLIYFVLFVVSSLLMVWRLECLSARGFEGTVVGTLVMPYCSGLGNLLFVYVLLKGGGDSSEIVVNSIVNNVTNMTLLLGLPAVIWGLQLKPEKRVQKKMLQDIHINKLSLILTMVAVLFFGGIVWALAWDGKLDLMDGVVLVAIFVFWQCFQVFDVLKNNVRKGRAFSLVLILDAVLLLVGAVALYISVEGTVACLRSSSSGFFSVRNLGWLTGWLMVLPNALLAFYYAWKKKADVVYASQIGDGHICIPLAIGVFAIFKVVKLPEIFNISMLIILVVTLLHMLFVATLGRLPKWVGWALIGVYLLFLYQGLA